MIYGKGTAVAHEISGGKAVAAILLPIIVGAFGMLLVLILLVLFIAMGSR